MRKAMYETSRRRKLQEEYNIEHGITPQTILKAIHAPMTSGGEDGDEVPSSAGKVIKLHDKAALAKRALRTGAGSGHGRSVWSAAESAAAVAELDMMDPTFRLEEIRILAGEHFTKPEEIGRSIVKMENEMKEAARAMQFEKAAELRDRLKRLKVIKLGV